MSYGGPGSWEELLAELRAQRWSEQQVAIEEHFGNDWGNNYYACRAGDGWEWGYSERGTHLSYGSAATEGEAARGLRAMLVESQRLPADPRGPWLPRGHLTYIAADRRVEVTVAELEGELEAWGVTDVGVVLEDVADGRVAVTVEVGSERLECGSAADSQEAGTFVRRLLVDRGLLPDVPV